MRPHGDWALPSLRWPHCAAAPDGGAARDPFGRQFWPAEFYRPGYVVCDRCAGPAEVWAYPMPPDAIALYQRRDTDHLERAELRRRYNRRPTLRCLRCPDRREIAPVYRRRWPLPRDRWFERPFVAQTPTRDGTLYAINRWHLDCLRRFVARPDLAFRSAPGNGD